MTAISKTATVMFVDMVGSTSMLDEIGDAEFAKVQHRYTDQVRRALGRHGGTEIKGTGDGTLATFESAAEAVAAAVEIQQFSVLDLDAGNRSPALRVGISIGDCRFEDDDVFGVPVVVAARLCDRATPGDILITDMVATIASMSVKLATGEPVELELKGLSDPVSARTVIWRSGSAGGLPIPGHLTFDIGFPFCGRQAELAQIESAYNSALGGELHVVAVIGEPGIGKTRLLGASAAAFHERGATVLFGTCDEFQSIAHQPISEWIDFVVEHADPAALDRLLGDDSEALAVLSPVLANRVASTRESSTTQFSGERHQLYRSVSNWLRVMAEDRPLLLVVDDIQWATPATTELLSTLVRAPGLGRILLVATMRDTEAEPNEAVADLFTQLHRTNRFSEMPIGGLEPAAIEELMTKAAGRDLQSAERAAVGAIAESTNGNVLFVTELVRHLVETEVITRDEVDGELEVHVADIEVPSSVRSIVDQRVRRLGSAARPVLEAAAVLGARFDPAVVADIAQVDEDQLDDALASALDAHLLIERALPAPQVEFSHAIVRDTVYGLINSRRRLQMHRTAGRVLHEQLGEMIDERVLAIAHHVFASQERDVERAVGAATRAARFATRALDHGTAADWYERALGRAETGRYPVEQLIQLQIDLGVAQKRAGRDGYRASLLKAADMAAKAGDDVARRTALLATHRGVYASAGHVDAELVAALESAISETPENDIRNRALLGAQLASELTWDADLDRKVAYALEAERQVRTLSDPGALARVLTCISDVMEIVDAPDVLIGRSSELLDLGRELGDDRSTFFGALDLATAALMGGHVEQARYAIDVGYDALERLGEPILETHLNPRKASLLIATGSFNEGLEVAQRGFEMRLDAKQPEALMVFAGHQFEVLRHRGQLALVEDILADTAEQNPALKVYGAALGLIYCATDRADQAAELWAKLTEHGVMSLFEGVQNVAINAAVYAELAFVLDHQDSARVLLDVIEPRLAEFAFAGPSLRGPMTGYQAMVHATLGNTTEARRLFSEAIVQSEQAGLAPEATHSRVNAAAYLERLGDVEAALSYARDANASATELGMDGAAAKTRELIDRHTGHGVNSSTGGYP